MDILAPLHLYYPAVYYIYYQSILLYPENNEITCKIKLKFLDKIKLSIENNKRFISVISYPKSKLELFDNGNNFSNELIAEDNWNILIGSLVADRLNSKVKNNIPISLYYSIIFDICITLLKIYPIHSKIINDVYQIFLDRSRYYFRTEQNSMYILPYPKSKLNLFNDISIFDSQKSLKESWIILIGAILANKKNECKEFWNDKCIGVSNDIWFPDEITDENNDAWFSTISQVNTNNIPKYNYVPENTPDIVIENKPLRAIKLKLKPNYKQKKIFKEWCNTTRYVYNRIINRLKNNPEINPNKHFNMLNKEYITKKDNNIIKKGEEENLTNYLYEWEENTPKDIRKGALRDIKKGYNTAWANIKAGNIKKFDLNYRQKKNLNEQSLEIPPEAIKIKQIKNLNKKSYGIIIYSKYKLGMIKISKRSIRGINLTNIKRTVRLKQENNQWYICVSMGAKIKNNNTKEKTCALDPGIRKFQTIYSEDKITMIKPNKELVERLHCRLDKLQGKRAKKEISKKIYNKKQCKIQEKITNLVNDMHYKVISSLTKEYTAILLPSFESQDMVKSNKLPSKVKRKMMNYSFYKFQQRLIHKSKLQTNCNVYIVNEAYTSKTCGYCGYSGELNKTSEEKITCGKCSKSYDRDINGSRNIYIKMMTE